jgi:hypothetical protein
MLEHPVVFHCSPSRHAMGQSKLGATQLALTLDRGKLASLAARLLGESLSKWRSEFFEPRCLKILAAPDSVRRAREALSFSAARFPFSIVVPRTVRRALATNGQLIKRF